jgi:hypothetical protein
VYGKRNHFAMKYFKCRKYIRGTIAVREYQGMPQCGIDFTSSVLTVRWKVNWSVCLISEILGDESLWG